MSDVQVLLDRSPLPPGFAPVCDPLDSSEARAGRRVRVRVRVRLDRGPRLTGAAFCPALPAVRPPVPLPGASLPDSLSLGSLTFVLQRLLPPSFSLFTTHPFALLALQLSKGPLGPDLDGAPGVQCGIPSSAWTLGDVTHLSCWPGGSLTPHTLPPPISGCSTRPTVEPLPAGPFCHLTPGPPHSPLPTARGLRVQEEALVREASAAGRGGHGRGGRQAQWQDQDGARVPPRGVRLPLPSWFSAPRRILLWASVSPGIKMLTGQARGWVPVPG